MKKRSISIPHTMFSSKGKEGKKEAAEFTLRKEISESLSIQLMLFKHLHNSFNSYYKPILSIEGNHLFKEFIHFTHGTPLNAYHSLLSDFQNSLPSYRMMFFNFLLKLYKNPPPLSNYVINDKTHDLTSEITAIITAYLGILFESKVKLETPDKNFKIFSSTVKALLNSLATLKYQLEEKKGIVDPINSLTSALQEDKLLNDSIRSQLSFLDKEIETRCSWDPKEEIDEEEVRTKENERSLGIIKELPQRLEELSQSEYYHPTALQFSPTTEEGNNLRSNKASAHLLGTSPKKELKHP